MIYFKIYILCALIFIFINLLRWNRNGFLQWASFSSILGLVVSGLVFPVFTLITLRAIIKGIFRQS